MKNAIKTSVLVGFLGIFAVAACSDDPAPTPGANGTSGSGGSAAGAGGGTAGAGGSTAGAGGSAAGAGGSTAGAGGSSAGAGGSAGSATGTTSVSVTAKDGGTVADPGGKGSLAIPAGALAADTTITLAVRAPENGAATDIFDFGPDGTMFTPSAKLSIKVGAGDIPAGKTYALAVLENGAWKEIPGSTFADGTLTGDVAHFSSFTGILVDGKIVPAGVCKDEIASFAACGGDEKGTYTYELICPKAIPLALPGCTEAVVETLIETDQTVTLDGATSVTSAGKLTLTGHTIAPKTCYAKDAPFACSQLNETDEDGTTTCVDAGDKCDCKNVIVKDQPAKTAPYTISGNTYSSESASGTYCVQGDRLRIDIPGEQGAFYVYKKK